MQKEKNYGWALDSARKNPYNSRVAHPGVAQLVARMVRERPNFKFLRILKFWLRDSFFCTLSFLKKQRSYARMKKIRLSTVSQVYEAYLP